MISKKTIILAVTAAMTLGTAVYGGIFDDFNDYQNPDRSKVTFTTPSETDEKEQTSKSKWGDKVTVHVTPAKGYRLNDVRYGSHRRWQDQGLAQKITSGKDKGKYRKLM